jgi:hypothetical protein
VAPAASAVAHDVTDASQNADSPHAGSRRASPLGGGRDSPRRGAIGTELVQASRELKIRPYASLWHAILFYTSGELTRRALATRGVPDYRPVINDMYGGPYRGFQKPLETHWQAYLDGKVSREEAIRQILIETAPPPKK